MSKHTFILTLWSSHYTHEQWRHRIEVDGVGISLQIVSICSEIIAQNNTVVNCINFHNVLVSAMYCALLWGIPSWTAMVKSFPICSGIQLEIEGLQGLLKLITRLLMVFWLFSVQLTRFVPCECHVCVYYLYLPIVLCIMSISICVASRVQVQ